MNSEEIKSAIDNRVNSNDEFAIMIDGAWGTGKTYFLRNTIVPKLKNEGKNVTYFSVYGFNSLEEIKRELTQCLFISTFTDKESNVKQWSKTINLVGSSAKNIQKLQPFGEITSAFSKYLMTKQINSNKADKNNVLIIDDLERLNRKISLVDLFGYILTELIEVYNCRVILVGSKKDITKQQLNDFNRGFEKLINHILPFSQDIKMICDELLNDNSFTFQNKEWIKSVIEVISDKSTKPINLRTLNFIFNQYNIIYKNIDDELQHLGYSLKQYNRLVKAAFLNLYIVSTLYREGIIKKSNVSSISNLINTRNFPLVENAGEGLPSKIIKRFHNFSFKDDIVYLEEMNDAVFEGYFRADLFVTKWRFLFESKKADYLSKISKFREMTDLELIELQTGILAKSEGNYYSFKDNLQALNTFLFFDQNNLLLINEPEYKQIFLKSLEISAKNSDYNSHDMDIDELGFYYGSIAKEDNGHFVNELQKLLKKALGLEEEQLTRSLLDSIFNDEKDETKKIVNSGFKANIFKFMLENNYLPRFIVKQESKANRLSKFLHSEYIRISNIKDFHINEFKDIVELIENIKLMTNKNQTLQQIDKFKIHELIDILEEVGKKLE